MNDIETKLRVGLEAFTAETGAAAVLPSIASIALRARTTSMTRPRWPKVAIAIGAGLFVTTGVASAAGVLPGPVASMVREFRSWGFAADGTATRMAATTDGVYTYEVWAAPLEGGGQCVYDRVVGPDGDVDHGGSSSCITDPIPTNGFEFLHYPEQVHELEVASGKVPAGATQVVFELDDGTTHTVQVQTNGWFITTFPGVHDASSVVAVRALDADRNAIG